MSVIHAHMSVWASKLQVKFNVLKRHWRKMYEEKDNRNYTCTRDGLYTVCNNSENRSPNHWKSSLKLSEIKKIIVNKIQQSL